MPTLLTDKDRKKLVKETCRPSEAMYASETAQSVPFEANELGGINTKPPLYPGDTILQEVLQRPLRDGKFHAFDFKTSFELVSFYTPHIADGSTTLHLWQMQVAEEWSLAVPTSKHPLRYCLCACNGSGKDIFEIAPFAIFFALCKIKSRCIITSSSGVQLTSQTETYIRQLAQAVNDFHNEDIFKINQRYIYCRLSGSEIRLFATDEEGKAEGYHPMEPGREMCVILNEAKSISSKIYRALARCTGYNYWLEVSTPGAPSGDFYEHFTNKIYFKQRHVTTFDCPHLSEEDRQADLIQYGEHSAIYRSKHLALFTSLEENVIISIESVNKLKKLCLAGNVIHECGTKRYGLDLAAGGDETVLLELDGNRISRKFCFTEKDTVAAAMFIAKKLNEWGVELENDMIFADDGGVGRGIIDNLVSTYGYKNIHRILNQSVAVNKKEFINRGAEAWFRAKRMIDECCIILDFEDEKFIKQITSRYYKQGGTSVRVALESKAEAKSHGRPSPDRADAFILALTGLTVDDFLGKTVSTEKKASTPRTRLDGLPALKSAQEIADWIDKQRYAGYEEPSLGGRKMGGSLNSLLNKLGGRKEQQYESD